VFEALKVVLEAHSNLFTSIFFGSIFQIFWANQILKNFKCFLCVSPQNQQVCLLVLGKSYAGQGETLPNFREKLAPKGPKDLWVQAQHFLLPFQSIVSPKRSPLWALLIYF